MYIEFRVFRKKKKKEKKKSWRCKEGSERLLPVGRFGSRQRFSLSLKSFLALCHDMVFRLQVVAGSQQGFS